MPLRSPQQRPMSLQEKVNEWRGVAPINKPIITTEQAAALPTDTERASGQSTGGGANLPASGLVTTSDNTKGVRIIKS